MSYDITKQKDFILQVLEDYKETRDCDNKLIARIWHIQISDRIERGVVGTKKPLALLYNGELIAPTSIIRVRRLLQIKFEHVRGEKYIKRATKLEEQARESINNFNYNEYGS